MKKKNSGFTLVELMVVIAIVGILGAIAIPSYKTYVLKSYRSQAFAFLQDLAFKQETFYNMNGRYGWLANLDANGLGVTERNRDTIITSGTVIIDGRYQLTNGRGTDTFWYLLRAVGDQAADTGCTFIRLDHTWQVNDAENADDRFCFTS
ncbi:MAG: type IV pilin protein [Granulosicoccaceae bacterium]